MQSLPLTYQFLKIFILSLEKHGNINFSKLYANVTAHFLVILINKKEI